MDKLDKLRMELKADIELMAIRQQDVANYMDRMSERLDRMAAGQTQLADQLQATIEQVLALGRQAQETARQMAELTREVAGLGREVAESSRWMQGRLRQMGERFDKILEATGQDRDEERALLHDLRARVENLERQIRPPAA